MTDSPIGDAEGRLRDCLRAATARGLKVVRVLGIDLADSLARLETAERVRDKAIIDQGFAVQRVSCQDETIRGWMTRANKAEVRAETAEWENKRLEIVAAEAAQLSMEEHNRIAALTRERDEALRRAAPIAPGGSGPRRDAAKKLLCDICACAAESDNLDLPHVITDCIEPLETLICERDACLHMATETRRFLGPDGPLVLDAIALRSVAEAERDRLTALIRDTAIPALEPMRSAAMTLASQAGAARENNRRGASEWEPSRALILALERASQAHAKLSAEVGS